MYVELTDIKNRIVDGLTTELKNEPTFDADLLNAKVEAAIIEIEGIRDYPDDYTADMVEKDMERFYRNIRALALYDYNQIGIEYQLSATENGIARNYMSRNKLLYGVRPLAVRL